MTDLPRGTSAQITIPADLRAKLLVIQAKVEGQTGKKPRLSDLIIDLLYRATTK